MGSAFPRSGSSRMNRVSQRHLLAVGVLALVALVVVLILGVEQKTIVAALLYCLIASYLVLTAGGDGNATELLEGISSSVRRMLDGRRPEAPREAPPAVVRL